MDIRDSSTWTLLYFASEWVIRLAMLVVVPSRRSPDAAKAWLLFAFFLPWPALILYHLIGRPAYPRWRQQRFERLPGLLAPAMAQIARTPASRRPALPENLAEAAILIEKLGRLPVLAGNEAELLPDYGGSLARLVADIDGARSHVHLVFYIFADDATGRTVMDALLRAVQRGVTCRVLIDALGSHHWARRVVERLSAGGVEIRLALALGFFRRRSARADLRNHRKIAVIDGRIGYTGSQNIVDADFRPGVVNQELVVRVTGPIVLELQAVFVADWYLETEQALGGPDLFPALPPSGEVAAQVLPSGPDYPTAGVEHLIVALIHGARHRVAVTTPYFVPDEPLLQALQTAAMRGVEVHLVVSGVADHPLVHLAQRSYYAELLRCGVHIHLFRDKLLHAKHLSVDGEVALIGSSNVDIRSFVLNAEVSLVAYSRDVVARLRAEQERYFAASVQLSSAAWAERSPVGKFAENLARLLSPLL